MQDFGLNAIAGNKTPGSGIKETGPHFAIGYVDQHGGVIIRKGMSNGNPSFHFIPSSMRWISLSISARAAHCSRV